MVKIVVEYYVYSGADGFSIETSPEIVLSKKEVDGLNLLIKSIRDNGVERKVSGYLARRIIKEDQDGLYKDIATDYYGEETEISDLMNSDLADVVCSLIPEAVEPYAGYHAELNPSGPIELFGLFGFYEIKDQTNDR